MTKNIIYIVCVISIIWSSEMLINDKALSFCINKTEPVLDFSEDIQEQVNLWTGRCNVQMVNQMVLLET